MRKNRRNKHILAIMLIFMVVFTCIPVASGSIEANAATKEKKGVVYKEIIKRKNIVFCAYNEDGESTILKVNLNNGSKTVLAKNVWQMAGLKIKGNYIYYAAGSSDIPKATLYRVNIKTRKKQKLANVYLTEKCVPAVVFGKNKIYYREAYWSKKTDFVASRNKQMKLNGTGKKRIYNTKIRVTGKRSNVSGYKVIYKGVNYHYDPDYEDYEYEYYKCYLKKPNGKLIYLAKVDDYW